MNNFKEILNELSYRVSSGIPDLTNEQHLIKLWDILKEHNWSIDARVELLKNLSNQDIQKPNLLSEALMDRQEIYKDGGKYAVMLLKFINDQTPLKTKSGDMITLNKSNLKSKGIGGQDTLEDVLKNPTSENVDLWFGSGKKSLLDTKGNMWNITEIDKGKFSGKSVGGGGNIDAANYEMGICMAHAMLNKNMDYQKALGATGIDRTKYEKYREVVEPVGEKIAKNISSYPLLSHSGTGKASVVNPYTNNTPKTDIYGGSSHRISLKQAGGAQLMSGGSADTKGVFVGAKEFWSEFEKKEMNPLVNEIIGSIDNEFKKISGNNTVTRIKQKFGEYYLNLRRPEIQKELSIVKSDLMKDKVWARKLKKESNTIDMHIKVEMNALGLFRGSSDPTHIIPGVSQVTPNKVSREFQDFFKTYDNMEAADEARKVLEHSMDIKENLAPKFDKIWASPIFKKWVVYEAASGNYKFSGDSNLNSSQAAMANRILQFNSSGNVKDVMITPDWAKGYSSKVKSSVGYKTAGKTKQTSWRLMTEQGVENPENYNSLFEYELEKILNTENKVLTEGINKIIQESQLLQEGFLDNLRKKGQDFVKGIKKAFTKLMSNIKSFVNKYFIQVFKKISAKLKQFAKQGFNFFADALGIEVDGSSSVGAISL